MKSRLRVKGAKSPLMAGALVVLALLVTGCAGQTGAQTDTGAVAPTAAAQPTVMTKPTTAAEPTLAATAVMPDTVTGPATVMIAANGTLGDILVDARGLTLYLFTKDTPNTSNCYDQCATNWPPLLTEGQPAVGAGADDSKIGTTRRTDGTMQVTYNGWPLYYWAKDLQPGDATGQNVGGVWFVLDRDGDGVGMPGGDDSASSSAGKTIKVSIKNFSFGQPLTVAVGTTVVWTNEDSMDHTVTAADNSFDSGTFGQGETFSFTFTRAGSFDYTCALHPNMKGNVTVTG